MAWRLRRAQLGLERMQQMKHNTLHGATVDILKLPDGCESTRFEFRLHEEENWVFFDVIISYCCDFLEMEDMSHLIHELAVWALGRMQGYGE